MDEPNRLRTIKDAEEERDEFCAEVLRLRAERDHYKVVLEEIATQPCVHKNRSGVTTVCKPCVAEKALRYTKDPVICEGCEKKWERWPDEKHHRQPGKEAIWVPCLKYL